jgi:RNA polymerase sigma-70 factor (ECF subfamily)
LPVREPSAHQQLERGEQAAIIRRHVAALPPHLADAILLRYFEELSEKEIAAQTGVPLGTVKSRLHTAVKRLRIDLERMLNA